MHLQSPAVQQVVILYIDPGPDVFLNVIITVLIYNYQFLLNSIVALHRYCAYVLRCVSKHRIT